jgi:hypothetical protein
MGRLEVKAKLAALLTSPRTGPIIKSAAEPTLRISCARECRFAQRKRCSRNRSVPLPFKAGTCILRRVQL